MPPLDPPELLDEEELDEEDEDELELDEDDELLTPEDVDTLPDEVDTLPEDVDTLPDDVETPPVVELVELLSGQEREMRTSSIAVLSWSGAWADAGADVAGLDDHATPRA